MRGLASQIHEESSSLSSQVDKLYWMCFRDPGDNFVGIVISRGKSPGATASAVINDGIVESEKATILALDEKYAAGLQPYMDRLLGEDMAKYAADKVGLVLKATRKITPPIKTIEKD